MKTFFPAIVNTWLREQLYKNVTAPGVPPAGQVYIYVDTVDNLYKIKMPSGNVISIPDSALTVGAALSGTGYVKQAGGTTSYITSIPKSDLGALSIVDADVSATAAILLSKLATGALPSGITIADANVVAGAAIALSKLATGALPSGITIADANVVAGAAIALSKLATGALPSGITIADANVVVGAAIALSKLATGALPSGITIADANVIAGANLAISKLNGYPTDASKFLRGDGTWNVPSGYSELGRTTLAAGATVITVSGLTARKNILILFKLYTASGATTFPQLTINNDTTAVYTWQRQVNGTFTSAIGANNIQPINSNDANHKFGFLFISNISGKDKMYTGTWAADTNAFYSISGTYVSTAAQLTRVDMTNGGTGNFDVNSDVIVLGFD